MALPSCYFIDLDTQQDFFSSRGKQPLVLEPHLKKNLKALTQHALQAGIPVLSFVEAYNPKDFTKAVLPKHAIHGSTGYKKIPETLSDASFLLTLKEKKVNYQKLFKEYPQIIVEKQQYDIFTNKHTLPLMQAGGRKCCVVYGGGLDYGLEKTALGLIKAGFTVYIPVDAIAAFNEDNRMMSLVEMRKLGAEMWNTEFIMRGT